jgi:lipopolysaccharide/colanic/teichoic acid biosynthesis glycosyltransferase
VTVLESTDAVFTAGPAAVSPLEAPDLARWVKAIGERVAAAVLLLLAIPILVLAVLAIRLDSPGPAVFRQRRVGKDGREFTMLKLRTMCTDAERIKILLSDANESPGGVLFKIKADPRVTRIGRFLRRLSVDEVPQLVNVLRGEMALIGPRPALPDEVAQYDATAARRLEVKPGLTGLWQVSGRSDLPWDEAIRLDVEYVDNWSLGLDLRIICRTAGAVLGRRGAY